MKQQNAWLIYLGWGTGIAAIATLSNLFFLRHNPQALPQPDTPNLQTENATSQPTEMITYKTIEHPRSLVYVVRIPVAQTLKVIPIIASEGLETIDRLAQENGAIAAINAGFFDPNNGKTTSFVIKDGQLILDPNQNSRLIDNPSLANYMPQILNRSEFRRYQCQSDSGMTIEYAIAPRQASISSSCQLLDAVGAGPALLPSIQGEREAFLDPQTGRDAIGSLTPNARSAVGITAEGHIVLILATQRADISSPSGLTLTELAEIMIELGVQQGLNLDGGSSSSLYYKGKTYYGRLDVDQKEVKRPIKSALAVLSTN